MPKPISRNCGSVANNWSRPAPGLESSICNLQFSFINLQFPRPVKTRAAAYILFFAFAALLQFLSGAYRSEFGGHPDEAAHYVTGLMVRDFIATPRAWTHPKAFADDFSKLLVTATSPFRKMPSLPSMHKVSSMLGGAPKEAACEAFGRDPGVTGLVADTIGLPPEWTDKGAALAPVTADNSLQ